MKVLFKIMLGVESVIVLVAIYWAFFYN